MERAASFAERSFEGTSALLLVAGGVSLVRLLPFAIGALFDRAIAWRRRLPLVGLGVGLSLAWRQLRGADDALLGVVTGGCLLHLLAARLSVELLPRERLDRARAFEWLAAVLLLHLAAPALLIPRAWWIVLAPMTMDALLSSASLALHASARGLPSQPRAELARFVVIHPELVFPPPEPSMPSAGVIARTLAGGAATLLVASATTLAAPRFPSGCAWLLSATSLVLHHLGSASLREGLAAWSGHPVTHGYRAPWRASGPRDFWRRWNGWYQRWIERHVFRPLLRASTLRRLPRALRSHLATSLAFGASGLIHVFAANAFAEAPARDGLDLRQAWLFLGCLVQYELLGMLGARVEERGRGWRAAIAIAHWGTLAVIVRGAGIM